MRTPLDKTLVDKEPSRAFDHAFAGTVLLDSHGNCIVQRRSDHAPITPGGIGHFGGGRESHETFAECAARELFEELRLAVKPVSLTLLGYLDIREDDGSVTRCAFFVLHDVDISKLELHEGKGIIVESPDAALHEPMLAEGARLALHKVLRRK